MHLGDGQVVGISFSHCLPHSHEKLTKIQIRSSWKSVRTLLIIACLADSQSYVAIIFANSCAKLTKSENYQAEVGSNIAKNRLYSP